MILNLHDDVEASDLQEIFGEVGTVLGSKVDRNADGSSKGTGEVLMATRAQAEKAKTEFDAADVNGRIIGVRMLGAAGGGRGRVQVHKHQQGRAQPFAGRSNGRGPTAQGYGGFQGPAHGGRPGPVQFQVTLDAAAAAAGGRGRAPGGQLGGRNRDRQQQQPQQRKQAQASAGKQSKKAAQKPKPKASKPKTEKPAAKPAPTQAELDAEMEAYMTKMAK